MFNAIFWDPGLFYSAPGMSDVTGMGVAFSQDMVWDEPLYGLMFLMKAPLVKGVNLHVPFGLSVMWSSFDVYSLGDVADKGFSLIFGSLMVGVEGFGKYHKVGVRYDFIEGVESYFSLGKPLFFLGEVGFTVVNLPPPFGLLENSPCGTLQGPMGIPKIGIYYRKKVVEIESVKGLEVRGAFDYYFPGFEVTRGDTEFDYSSSPRAYSVKVGLLSPCYKFGGAGISGGLGVDYAGEVNIESLVKIRFAESISLQVDASILGEPWIRLYGEYIPPMLSF